MAKAKKTYTKKMLDEAAGIEGANERATVLMQTTHHLPLDESLAVLGVAESAIDDVTDVVKRVNLHAQLAAHRSRVDGRITQEKTAAAEVLKAQAAAKEALKAQEAK